VTSATKPKPTTKKPATKKAVAKKAVAKKAVAPEPVAAPAPKVATPKPLVAKERARRKVVLPFRERLEEAMHRELKHVGPVCHPCRMNGSRLAALASMPAVVAV
jgi:hypothetical protein